MVVAHAVLGNHQDARVGLGDRHRLGLAFNEMVASGELKAPIVIGRDHLDCGSVASPNRETEAMKDGTDAVSDWPLLNFAANIASGASWVSFHHGGGVGTASRARRLPAHQGGPRSRRELPTAPALAAERHRWRLGPCRRDDHERSADGSAGTRPVLGTTP